MDRIQQFVKERDEVLFSLDRKRIEKYLRKRGIEIPKNDIVFWAGIYKGICNTTTAPADLVLNAKSWLYAHGMSERVSF